MKQDKIYLFTHIPKTAGMNILKHIRKNFKPDEYIELNPITLNIPCDSSSAKIRRAIKTYFSYIGPKARRKIKVVYGHYLPYGVHNLFKRDPYYFTFQRDPLSRIVSLYNYNRTLYTDAIEKNHPYFNQILLIRNKIPSFDVWYDHFFGKKADIRIMNSARILDKLGYKSLKIFEFIGTTENFTEDALYMYHKMNITKFFMKQNVSKRFKKHLDATEIKKITKENKDAFELYSQSKIINEALREKSEYKDITTHMKVKQKMIMPITQIIYDSPDIIHRTSSLIREHSTLYAHLVDSLKRSDI